MIWTNSGFKEAPPTKKPSMSTSRAEEDDEKRKEDVSGDF
jgi:hypothetical protein